MVGLFEQLANNAPAVTWRSHLDRHCYFFNGHWLDFTWRTYGLLDNSTPLMRASGSRVDIHHPEGML